MDHLIVLDLSDGLIFSLNGDGSDQKVIVAEYRDPDGIAIDVEGEIIYWTQKSPFDSGKGCMIRAGIKVPRGQYASLRIDI